MTDTDPGPAELARDYLDLDSLYTLIMGRAHTGIPAFA